MSKKFLIAFGTRPELIKLAPLINLIKASPIASSVLIVNTGQHRELLANQLEFWGITPDVEMSLSDTKQSLTRLLAETLMKFQDLLETYSELEYICAQGDTNTALATAQFAYLNRLKPIHIEAGLRTNNLLDPFPEEFNRIMASKVAYFHFAPTNTTRNNLLDEGVPSSKIRVTGNTVIDALLIAGGEIMTGDIKKKHVLVTLHRRENISHNFKNIAAVLNQIKNKFPDQEIIWIGHPNSSDKIEEYLKSYPDIRFTEHLPYTEFIKLYKSTSIIITDSGGVTEEATELGLPIVVYRHKTERTEAVNTDYPILVPTHEHDILEFVNKNISTQVNKGAFYGTGNASQLIFEWIQNELKPPTYDTIIIGGGPAGTGILMKSIKDGTLDEVLSKGVAVIEKSANLLRGALPDYLVNSDTQSNVFLECLDGAASAHIDIPALKKEIQIIKKFENSAIPLRLTDDFLKNIGVQLIGILERHAKSEVYLNTEVVQVKVLKDDSFEVYMSNHKKLNANKIILACGGIPKRIFTDRQSIYNTIHSDDLLRGNGMDKINQLTDNPQVIIVGGNHSGFSAAWYLLENFPQYFSKDNPITIWCDANPKIFFDSEKDARDFGYSDFTADDICRVTGRVYRLAGLRMDGRELYMNMLENSSDIREQRVHLKHIKENREEYEANLTKASLIIEATGYEFNIPEFINPELEALHFKGADTLHWVNEKCQLVLADNEILKNAFAIGLATGYIPRGELGGEISFTGQTNGLWYYQNLLAEVILKQISYEDTPAMS